MFNLSWEEFNKIPPEIIMNDLYMLNLKADIEKQLTKTKKQKHGKN